MAQKKRRALRDIALGAMVLCIALYILTPRRHWQLYVYDAGKWELRGDHLLKSECQFWEGIYNFEGECRDMWAKGDQ